MKKTNFEQSLPFFVKTRSVTSWKGGLIGWRQQDCNKKPMAGGKQVFDLYKCSTTASLALLGERREVARGSAQQLFHRIFQD